MVYDWPYWEAVADEVLAAATACSADAEDSGGPSEAAVPRDIGRADVQETLETWRGGHGGGFPGAKARRLRSRRGRQPRGHERMSDLSA